MSNKIGITKFRKTNTTVYSCQYHIIWCPKYRRKVLVGDVAKRFKEIVAELREPLDFEIYEMEVMPDHVHLLLDINPLIGVNQVVTTLKDRTAHILRKEFPHLKRVMPNLWTRSKFISTVGAITLDVVKQYIEAQETKWIKKSK